MNLVPPYFCLVMKSDRHRMNKDFGLVWSDLFWDEKMPTKRGCNVSLTSEFHIETSLKKIKIWAFYGVCLENPIRFLIRSHVGLSSSN